MALPRCSTPRNVYIDAGVNWCNTLEMYKQVPEASSRLNSPWMVFGFEASPRIAPFADRCAQALSAGEPMPTPPVPPAGSSRELAKYAHTQNCSMEQLGLRPKSEHDRKLYRRQRLVPCMLSALEEKLAALHVDPRLSANASLLKDRLDIARACAPPFRSSFVLLPAAVGEQDGSMSLFDGPEFMVTGGATHQFRARSKRAERHSVSQVDLSSWLRSSFTEDDFVILKLDVEGGEHRIVPKMVADGTLKLVDVFLWECHFMPADQHSKCHHLLKKLRDGGVKTIYEDPYPWTGRGKAAKRKAKGGRRGGRSQL